MGDIWNQIAELRPTTLIEILEVQPSTNHASNRGGVLDDLGTKIFVAGVCNADRLKWDVGGGLA